MARIFEYGSLNRVATKGNNFLPGQFTDAQGVYHGVGAIATDTNAYEYGELVEIVGRNTKGLRVKRATSSIALATAGFIIQDEIGQRIVGKGVVEGIAANSGLPFTVLPANATQGWGFVVPVSAAVEKGEQVYGDKTTLGALTNVSASNLELTGWKFASDSFKPTSGAGLCAFVEKV